MFSIPRQTLLEMWEQAQGLTHPELAAALLAAVYPDWPHNDILDLPIGQRDSALMAVYVQNFNASLSVIETCRHCQAVMEFDLDIPGLLQHQPATYPESLAVMVDKQTLDCRLPATRDLLAVLEEADPQTALLQRCLLPSPDELQHSQNHSQQESRQLTALAAPDRNDLERQLLEADPLAQVNIAVACHHCGERSETLFDIVPVLWKAWSDKAQRLLDEVVTLAYHFKWSEQSILNLSDQRRHYYLSRLGL